MFISVFLYQFFGLITSLGLGRFEPTNVVHLVCIFKLLYSIVANKNPNIKVSGYKNCYFV